MDAAISDRNRNADAGVGPRVQHVPKVALDGHGRFRHGIAAYEDMDFWLSALRLGFRGRIIDDTLLFYRVRTDSRYRQALSQDTYRRAMTRMLERHRALVDTHGLEILAEKERFLAELVEHHGRLGAERDAARAQLADLEPQVARPDAERRPPRSNASPVRVRREMSTCAVGPRPDDCRRKQSSSLTTGSRRWSQTRTTSVSAPDHFYEHLGYLRRHCTVMALTDLARAAEAGVLPPRAVCITFDDGSAML